MPAPKDPEFRRRAVELARVWEKPSLKSREIWGSLSCLRRWMALADVDEGKKEELSKEEKAEPIRPRRENRTQAMEIEILKRASAYFARENVLPK